MGGFKLKLVLWFALLALLPLAIAFYGYDSLAQRSETRRADASLEAGLGGAVAGYGARIDVAAASAQRLASGAAFQRALRKHNRAALAAIVRRTPHAAVEAAGLHIGVVPTLAAKRHVSVLNHGRFVGRVIVSVPVDAGLLRALGAGLPVRDRLVALRAGRIVAGPGSGSALTLAAGRAGRVRLAGTSYRGLQTAVLDDPPGLALALLAPQSSISSAARSEETRLALALLGSLVVFAFVTYLLGRSVVRTLRRLASAANALAGGRLDERVEVHGSDEFAQLGVAFNDMAVQLQLRVAELDAERGRSRDATARFGAALAATHDPAQLMKIVVESTVEATGAVGGLVISREGELARVGDPDAGAERIAFPLRVGSSDFGSLIISGEPFDAGEVETAASLVAQVVVALENERLHRVVERQALVDSLTGLANRRSIEDTLRIQLARAERFGEEISLVLADLDDFKRVNDRYGHPAGDEVLRAFAGALTGTARVMDVAGRWGGEEFALVLPATDALGAARLAERARAAIESESLQTEEGKIAVTASFGVASFPECRELGELIAAADSALYAAKREGKNRVVIAAESVPQ